MKFKVGDKVKIYSAEGIDYGHVQGINELSGNMGVKLISAHRIIPVHYKQCRRLIKKKRREIWVSKSDLSCLSGKFYLTSPGVYEQNDFIKFREVKE